MMTAAFCPLMSLDASAMNCSGLSRNLPNVGGVTLPRMVAMVRLVSWVLPAIYPSRSSS